MMEKIVSLGVYRVIKYNSMIEIGRDRFYMQIPGLPTEKDRMST